MAAGANAALDPQPARFLAGTWSAAASFGQPVRYDAAALVKSLWSYPLSCTEQIVSRGLPLALLPDGPIAGPERLARLSGAVQAVLHGLAHRDVNGAGLVRKGKKHVTRRGVCGLGRCLHGQQVAC